MIFQSLLMMHVCGATLALLSGTLAMMFPKGSNLHRLTGNVFFVSMVGMTLSAAYMAAFLKPVMLNMIVALLTFYLVATSWWAAKRKADATGSLDRMSLVFVSGVCATALVFGIEATGTASGAKDGYPAEAYFIFGSIALLCAISDFRMLQRATLSGMRRLARHLWRMCLAFLFALLSFYPGQARLFPEAWRETNLLYVPHVLLAGSMLFWMAHVSLRRRASAREDIRAPDMFDSPVTLPHADAGSHGQ